MAENEYIEHEGIVEDVLPKMVKVRIVNESACASCHAKGACTAADMQDKLIDVFTSDEPIQIGQKVMLMGKSSLAPLAVILAYVLPTALLFATLFLTYLITRNDQLAGALALLVLVPYFTVIYFLKNKLQKTFSFTIKHQIN
jgi:sigma-E factor negative regulatory protein RseC